METLAALAFLGCCALAVLVYCLFRRVDELKREIAWQRKYVHDINSWASQLHQYLSAHRVAAPAEARPEQAEPGESEPIGAPERGPVVELPKRAEPVEPLVVVPPQPVTPAPVHRPTPPAPAPPGPVVPPPTPVPPPVRRAPVMASETRAEAPPRPAAPMAASPAPSVAQGPVSPASPPPARPAGPTHATPERPRADLELTIGTRWLSRIGMVAVLAALVFLVWYLYDQGIIVITREMVIGAGLLLGLGLMVGAEFTHRRGYEPQSEALTGGGAAVLYITLWVGLHLWPILGASVTFVAMALVTAGAACQSLRHDSQTIAVLAWVAGYLVPLFIGEGHGGGSGESGAYGLFIYLTLLSVGVFVVAQRRAWPTFTGLALMGAHGGAAYIFRVSHGSLLWTLSYLLIISGGMMWVAVTQREKAGASYGAVGAIAGYLITGVAILAGGHGPLYGPYLYLLVLSGTLLVLARVYDWPTLQWCSAIGSIVGLLLLYHMGAVQLGNWLLLYAALSVAGSLASSSGRADGTEPLAITSVLSAYGAAALFVWSPTARSVSPEALFAYLGALAAGLLYISLRMEWEWLPRIGAVAAFAGTGLLYQHAPQGQLAAYPPTYLALLAIAVIAAAVRSDDRGLAGIGVGGAFAALPLTGVFGWGEISQLGGIVPVYLTLAGFATLAVIEWRKWFGLEWLSLGGVWLVYWLWRVVAERLEPTPGDLAFTATYLLIFLAASWVRHGARGEPATGDSGAFMVLNALVFFGLGWWDLSQLPNEWLAPGVLALSLFVLYLVAGVAAVRRCPDDAGFGPVLIGLAILFVTTAVPLIAEGYRMTVLWSLEAVVLTGLGFYYRSLGLRVGSLIVLTVALLRTIGLDNLVDREGYQVVLNGRGLGTGAMIAALYVCAYLYARLRDRADEGESWLPAGLSSVATVLLWWVVSAETWCYVGWQLGLGRAAQHFALSGAWIVFAATLIQIGLIRRIPALRWSGVGLLAMAALKVFAVDPPLSALTYALVVNSHSLPLLSIVGLLAELAWWHYRQADDEAPVLAVFGGLLLFWVCCSETWMYLGWVAQAGRSAQQMGLSMVWLFFGVGALLFGMVRRSAAFRWGGLVLFAFTLGKVFMVDPALTQGSYFPVANSQTFPLLIIAAVLYGVTPWYSRRRDELPEPEAPFGKAFPIAASVLLWWMLTSEAWRFTGWVLGGSSTAQQYALSAVWTLYAAALVTIGLIRRRALYRWTAMVLFALTIVKVFIFDLASLSLPFRVLAFMGLGAVLIAVSFGYQRLVRTEGGKGQEPGARSQERE